MDLIDDIQRLRDYDVQDETNRVAGAVADLDRIFGDFRHALEQGRLVMAARALREAATLAAVVRNYASDVGRALRELQEADLEERPRRGRR
jgi:hypothetical protein